MVLEILKITELVLGCSVVEQLKCPRNWERPRSARRRTDLEQVRVHDLKHTFGRRLRAEGVSFEDRQDLLGHRSGRITTHYSSAELQNLYDAANKVCAKKQSGVVLTLLRKSNVKIVKKDIQDRKLIAL